MQESCINDIIAYNHYFQALNLQTLNSLFSLFSCISAEVSELRRRVKESGNVKVLEDYTTPQQGAQGAVKQLERIIKIVSAHTQSHLLINWQWHTFWALFGLFMIMQT